MKLNLNDIKIRKAQGSDAYNITRLRHRSWISAYTQNDIATKEAIDNQFYNQLSSTNKMTELEQYFETDKHNCYVAEHHNQLLGIVWLNDNTQEQFTTCRMWGLYVDPKHQNQHIGTMLWNFAIRLATKLGYKKIELDTPSKNFNACNFYEHKGLTKTKSYNDELVEGSLTEFNEYEMNLN